MRNAKHLARILWLAVLLSVAGCGLITEFDDIAVKDAPSLDTTGGGDEGGTGSYNLPPD